LSCALIIALALVACSSSSDGTQAPADADDESSRRPHRDAQTSPRDAHGAPDARRGDAAVASDAGGGTTGDGGGGLAGAGVVACYSEYAPSATCALPTHCCFTNYSAARAGSCETAACTWGTIDCDGPEDCATGQRCCAHVIIDPDNGITGYKLACQTDACGAAPANVELCHGGATAAGTCDGDRACVSVANQDYDLPRTLSTCR
jgi:hypothetical protein